MSEARITREGLTINEEKFVSLYFESFEGDRSGNATRAYAVAYRIIQHPDDPIPKWVQQKACHLLKAPHIKKRLQALISRSEAATSVTIGLLVHRFNTAYEMALKNGEAGEMVRATEALAKLTGHMVERKRIDVRDARNLSREELMQIAVEAAQNVGLPVPQKYASLLPAQTETEDQGS